MFAKFRSNSFGHVDSVMQVFLENFLIFIDFSYFFVPPQVKGLSHQGVVYIDLIRAQIFPFCTME